MSGANTLTGASNEDFLAEAQRRAAESPELCHKLAQLAQTKIRPDVKSVLIGDGESAPDGQPDKFAQLNQTLAAQYTEWTEGIDGNKPTLEQVHGSFSPEQLEVANTYATPYLLMMPVLDDKDPDKITGYEPVIAEGKPEMDPYGGDDIRANLENRISARKEARRTGESGMTKTIWNRLFQAVKKAGQMIDARFYTMLEDDYSEGDPVVPFAHSDFGQPNFDRYRADDPHGDTRFRSTVRGNVLAI